MFTIFLRGRGGKGVATSLGVALALSPLAALCGFGVYVVVLRGYCACRRVGLAARHLVVPVFATLFVGGLPRPLSSTSRRSPPSLVTLRHRQNIARLLRGEEKEA